MSASKTRLNHLNFAFRFVSIRYSDSESRDKLDQVISARILSVPESTEREPRQYLLDLKITNDSHRTNNPGAQL